MAIQSDETLVTKGDLKTLYTNKIPPYLGGNMMMQTGVSDYYSTDEKVVGVWTDGKPIYQKAYTDIVISNASGTVMVDSTLNLNTINLINAFGNRKKGTSDYSGDYLIPNGADKQPIGVFVNSSGLMLIYSGQKAGLTCNLVVQYTKNVDAANSAAATPGCYDLNRPDLWPENVEIFFGNGLYGKRFTGTLNVTTSMNFHILDSSLKNINIFNNGGMIKRYAASTGASNIPIGSTYNESGIGIYAYFFTVEPGGIALAHKDIGNKSNVPYDIWAIYTK